MESSRLERVTKPYPAIACPEPSVEAWHDFVIRYSGLIVRLVRRYLVSFDTETQRDVYVQVLEHFYRVGLARYDGQAALSTWVMTVARSRCLDVLRRRRGWRGAPKWVARLSRDDQVIYQLYFVEGEDFAAITADFRRRGSTLTPQDFACALDHIEARVDGRLRTRLAYDLQARSVGASSGRLLEFVDQTRLEYTEKTESLRPDLQLHLDQTQLHLCGDLGG